MARESKRKRDERRFGRPERLADMASDPSILGYPMWWSQDAASLSITIPHLERIRDQFLAELQCRPLIVADNASDYYFAHDQINWSYMNDFPNCRLPFDSFYVESLKPPIHRHCDGVGPPNEHFPRAWGWLVDHLEPSRLERHSGIAAIDRDVAPMLDLPGIASIARCSLSVVEKVVMLPLMLAFYVPINSDGQILSEPKGVIDGVNEQALSVVREAGQFLQALMLTLSFLNCKNVTLDARDPDRAINRERRRAGLKPFVRYHTINIEPMKRVLRSEGGIEEHGLKRALHICRGHFATYADRMFGRELEKPVTVWRPAHVRGSAKEGVVVSDYRVNAPEAAR